ADAENLPFDDASFDIVYSWGVLHHTPDVVKAVQQVHRVLRPGGCARVMVYHLRSLTAFMLWLRYGLIGARPFRPLRDVVASNLESPGTKAFSREEVKDLFSCFRVVDVRVQQSFGDLLQGSVGQQHGGVLLKVAKRLWPRWALRRWAGKWGLYLLIRARK
ncbi:MAG: class I SAM-dependent methyltransferase, partial [Gemmatimonadota bacterium]